MTLFFGLLLVAGILVGLAWMFTQMKTEQATQSLRIVLGILGVVLGVVLTLRGLALAGIPVLSAGLGFLAVALGGGKARITPPPGQTTGPMSRKEAAEVLGVSINASEAEIRSAHRELMKRVHPDAGGSDALAARVQQARDILLGD